MSYLVNITITKCYDPEIWKECGWYRTYVDEIPHDDDGFSDDLGVWAIENGFTPRVLGKKVSCVRIDAKYYDEDSDEDYPDPVAELHTYIHKVNGKYELY